MQSSYYLLMYMTGSAKTTATTTTTAMTGTERGMTGTGTGTGSWKNGDAITIADKDAKIIHMANAQI